MNIKLKPWQTVALFLPVIIGCGILIASSTDALLANFFLVLTLPLITAYQMTIVINFNTASGADSTGHKGNAIIPVIFTVFFLARTTREAFLLEPTHHHHALSNTIGAHAEPDFGPKQIVYVLFFLHAFITYFFVNPLFVSKKIKSIKDLIEQKKLKTNFLTPMKRLTTITIVFSVIAAAVIYFVKS